MSYAALISNFDSCKKVKFTDIYDVNYNNHISITLNRASYVILRHILDHHLVSIPSKKAVPSSSIITICKDRKLT
jgi:hypothetical protein